MQESFQELVGPLITYATPKWGCCPPTLAEIGYRCEARSVITHVPFGTPKLHYTVDFFRTQQVILPRTGHGLSLRVLTKDDGVRLVQFLRSEGFVNVTFDDGLVCFYFPR